MSHKAKKPLTWYQLWSRIGKMKLTKTQDLKVEIKVDDIIYPCSLDFDENGNHAFITVIKD